MAICKWTVRNGINNSYWAFTPCKPGFNYLSRISQANEIKKAYNGCLCPICGNTIVCNTELVENEDEKSL